MNRIYFIVTLYPMMFALTACGGQKNSVSPPEIRDSENPSIRVNIPQPSISGVEFPRAKFPQAKFPQVKFPQAKFPQVKFPEVTFPDVKIQQNRNITIYTIPADILFDFDKANLRPDAEAALQQIANSIAQRFANAAIQIKGHTDSVGSDAYNVDLSKRRAESVQQWWRANEKSKPARLTLEGLGETQPVAPNTNPDGSDNPQGRQQNRRVEIVVRASRS